MNRETMTERRVLASLVEKEVDLDTIHDRLKHPFGHHRSISYNACVQSIARLEEDGLVTVTRKSDHPFGSASTTAGRPREKYAITDTGKDRLRSLAREPLRPAAEIL